MILLPEFLTAQTQADRTSAGKTGNRSPTTIREGQRIFSAGHSFHMFVPPILAELADAAEIRNHLQVGVQSIGGSYVHQHWDLADDKNKVKPALTTGEVDVLTLSPIYLPDDGIANLTELALAHHPGIRILIQEFWLPYDVFDKNYKKQRPAPVDRNARTGEELRKISAPYFAEMDAHVRELNRAHGREALFVVPTGQAVILLREKIIAGDAPGLSAQDELFRDAIGHGTPPLQALVAYCHYAVIYRRSPVGLPVPSVLQKAEPSGADMDKLNRLLQDLAWQAALEHPLSGVK